MPRTTQTSRIRKSLLAASAAVAFSGLAMQAAHAAPGEQKEWPGALEVEVKADQSWYMCPSKEACKVVYKTTKAEKAKVHCATFNEESGTYFGTESIPTKKLGFVHEDSFVTEFWKDYEVPDC